MASTEDVEELTMALEGTTAAPHVDRTAFKVRRIYATLAPDRQSLNLKLTRDEQEFKTLLAPEIYAAVPGGWGRMGWTTAHLPPMLRDELAAALRMAWEHGRATTEKRR